MTSNLTSLDCTGPQNLAILPPPKDTLAPTNYYLLFIVDDKGLSIKWRHCPIEPSMKVFSSTIPTAVLIMASTSVAQQPIKTYEGHLDWIYWDMAYVSDLDGDGFGEILLGEGGSNEGLSVVSSWSGLELFTFPGGSGGGGWVSACALGDTNGDAVQDFGAWFSNLATCFIWSGQDKGLLLQVPVPGGTLTDAGDVNGDGLADTLVGEVGWTFGPGSATVYLGGSYVPYFTVSDESPLGAGFTKSAAGLGDVNGDDFPDFLIGSPNVTMAGFAGAPGKLDLYSGAPVGVSAFGAPCALASGSLPRIGATGSPTIGTTYSMHLSQVEPGLDVFLAIGVSSSTWLGVPLPINLAVVGMPGCELLISLTKVFPAQALEVTPGVGAATFNLPIPDQSALVGANAYAQGFIANPPGSPSLGATTRALELTFH